MFRTVSLSAGAKSSPLRSYVSLTRYTTALPCQYIRRPATGRYKNDLRPRYHASVIAGLATIDQNAIVAKSQCSRIVTACIGNFSFIYSQVDAVHSDYTIRTGRCPPVMVPAISLAKAIPSMFLYTVE